MKYLKIVADTNDADYVTAFTKITDEQLEKYKPLFEAIKNFKPYRTKIQDGTRDWAHAHNFPYGDCCREDLGEKSAHELYEDLLPNDDAWNELMDTGFIPFGGYGIHTIKSIEIYDVNSIQEIL